MYIQAGSLFLAEAISMPRSIPDVCLRAVVRCTVLCGPANHSLRAGTADCPSTFAGCADGEQAIAPLSRRHAFSLSVGPTCLVYAACADAFVQAYKLCDSVIQTSSNTTGDLGCCVTKHTVMAS